MSIYNKTVPVYCCSDNNSVKRKSMISIRVSQEPGTSSPVCSSRDLVIQLTREDNPLFVFTLRITESDFHSLKSDQNLLVDFGGFPRMFTDLVDEVLAEDQKSEPKYSIYFTDIPGSDVPHLVSESAKSAILEIVESNRFKHLAHLTLRYEAANDTQLKKHLTVCLQTLKQNLAASRQQSRTVETDLKRKLQQTQESLNHRTTEVEKLKQLRQEDVKRLKEQHAETLSSCQDRLQKDQKRVEEDYKETNDRLKEALERNHSLEEEVERLRASEERLKAGNEQLQDESQQWQERYTQIERELDELPVLQRQLYELEQEMSDRERDIQKGEEKMRNLVNQKRRLEQLYQEQKEETEKGLDVLRKLIDKNRSEKEKARFHGEALVGQEQQLKKIDHQRQEFCAKVEKLTEENEKLQSENKKFETQILELNEKVAKICKETESKDSLISYLNRQLSDFKIANATAALSPLTQQPLFRPPTTSIPYSTANSINYRPVLGAANWNPTSTPAGSKPFSRLGGAMVSPVLAASEK